MTLTERDIETIQAYRQRVRELGKTSRAQEAVAVFQAFKGLYTLEQVCLALEAQGVEA
jgi:hypothetical protein